MSTSKMIGGEAEYNLVKIFNINTKKFHEELLDNYNASIQTIESNKQQGETSVTIFILTGVGFILQTKDSGVSTDDIRNINSTRFDKLHSNGWPTDNKINAEDA